MNDRPPADSDTYVPHRAVDARLPWPPLPGESVVGALGRTWQGAALQPRSFFGRIPADAEPGPAVLYYLLIGIAAEGAQLFWAMLLRPGRGTDNVTALLGAPGALAPTIDFLLSPLLLLFSLFVSAGVTHLMLHLLGGARRSYGVTVMVFAFAYSPQILGVVPYAGQAVGFVWMLVLAIVGLGAAHGTSAPRAAAAVLVPLVVALGLLAVAALVGAAGSLLIGGAA